MVWRGHGGWFFLVTYIGTMALWDIFEAIICIGIVGGVLGGLITNQFASKLDPAKIHHFMYIPISYLGYLYIIFSIFYAIDNKLLNICNTELTSENIFILFIFIFFGWLALALFPKKNNLNNLRKNQLKNYIKIISENFEKSVLLQKQLNSSTNLIDTESFFELKNMKLKFKKSDISNSEIRKIRICFASELVRFCLKRYKIDYQTIKINFFRMNNKEAGSIQNRNGIWYMKLEERFMMNDTALTSIIAHEMAHYALLRKNILLHPSIRNEELTDTASIIAGFAKVQLASKQITQEIGDNVSLEKLGYLSIDDILYIEKIKEAISGQDSIRKIFPIKISKNIKIKCLACMTNLKLPNKIGKLVIKCPGCQLKQKVEIVKKIGNIKKLLYYFYKFIDSRSGW
jgi:hypothetical protein